MTSDQVTAVSSAMSTTTSAVMTDFISILPSVGTIIGIAFVIGFVCYWLKKLRKAR